MSKCDHHLPPKCQERLNRYLTYSPIELSWYEGATAAIEAFRSL